MKKRAFLLTEVIEVPTDIARVFYDEAHESRADPVGRMHTS